MFCPPDYIPVSTLNQKLIEEGQLDLAREHCRRCAVSIVDLTKSRPFDYLTDWLFEFLEDHVYLSDASGHVMCIDERLINRQRFFFEGQGNFIFDDQEVTLSDLTRNRFDFCEGVSKQDILDYNALGSEYIYSTSKEQRLMITANIDDLLNGIIIGPGRTRPPLFVDQISFTVCMSLYNEIKQCDETLSNYVIPKIEFDQVRFIESFDGMALCTPRSHYEKNWDEYWQGFPTKLKTAFPELYKNSKRTRRKPKRECAALIARKEFPNGWQNHCSNQEEAIHTILDTAKKQGVDAGDPTTVKRALGIRK